MSTCFRREPWIVDARETLALVSQYNTDNVLTPHIDAGFAALAAERIRAHPFRYYVTLPLLRLADMWLRPRVEMLNIELRWWQYRLHHVETRISYAYGALNLLYLLSGADRSVLLAAIYHCDGGLCCAAQHAAAHARGAGAALHAGVLPHRHRLRRGCP